MSFAKKMKRAKARPEAKKLAVAERKQEKREYQAAWQMHEDGRVADGVVRARCNIHGAIALWLFNKVFKVSAREIRESLPRVNDLNWCLGHSYTTNGVVKKVPSVTYAEIEQCLLEECKFVFPRYTLEGASIKQQYCRQKLDASLLVTLFIGRLCYGFGRVRLTRLMEKTRELARTITYERYLEMQKEMLQRIRMDVRAKSNEYISEEMFGAWIYEEATA